MLVLARKVGESLLIGDDIEIKIVNIQKSEVKLGIEAPREIPVHRQEVHERIKAGIPHPSKE